MSRPSNASSVSSPIQFTSRSDDAGGFERPARSDDHLRGLRIELHDVERLAAARRAFRQAEPPPLPHGVVHDAAVPPEDAAFEVDDVAAARGIRPEPFDQVGVATGRNEADVLAVGLFGDRQAEMAREVARFRLGQFAQGKAQQVELRPRRGEEEVALIAVALSSAIEGTASSGRS